MNGCEPRLIELAGHINSQMPAFIVRLIADALNEKGKTLKGSNILSLGVSYKRDTNDLRESPALQVLEGLHRKGASISFSDPYVSSINLEQKTIHSVELTPETLRSMDCVVVLTDHSGVDYALVAKFGPLIVDTRNALQKYSRPDLIAL
jgi:UDP-N-acetyl-D-glucosamine dehydrogenase